VNRFYGILFLWLLNSIVMACQVEDDAGHLITLPHPAKRIISLAPDLTELLFAAGANDHIVGVMKGSDFPKEAKNIPIVANFNDIDVERVLVLHPDLIVVWAEGGILHQLKNSDVPIYVSHQHHLRDIPYTLERLGCLAGTEKIANKNAKQFVQRYHYLQKKYSTQKTESVFYEMWPKPLVTITKASWINEVITLCGGKNIFADLPGVAPEINLEAVIRANPAVIIGGKNKNNWGETWKAWPELSAVKHHAVFSMDDDFLQRAGPRILEGAQKMCALLEESRLQQF